ncbi:MAG TPA: hypothetical protein VNK24_08540 [Elusimicrobiota bacterium]|nr:hypothetical protein [Elusimicrobiota bacterium]
MRISTLGVAACLAFLQGAAQSQNIPTPPSACAGQPFCICGGRQVAVPGGCANQNADCRCVCGYSSCPQKSGGAESSGGAATMGNGAVMGEAAHGLGAMLGAALVGPPPPLPTYNLPKVNIPQNIDDNAASDEDIHSGVGTAQDIIGNYNQPPMPRDLRKQGESAGGKAPLGKIMPSGPAYAPAPSGQSDAGGGTPISADGAQPLSGQGISYGAPDSNPPPNPEPAIQNPAGQPSGRIIAPQKTAEPPTGEAPARSHPEKRVHGKKKGRVFGSDKTRFDDNSRDAKETKNAQNASACVSASLRARLEKELAAEHRKYMARRHKGLAMVDEADQDWCLQKLKPLEFPVPLDFGRADMADKVAGIIRNGEDWDDRCEGPAEAAAMEESLLKELRLPLCSEVGGAQ